LYNKSGMFCVVASPMRLFPQAVVTLCADVRVRSGGTLRIFSSGVATLVVGTHQLRVAAGGQLDLDRLVVADSERSSAILADGMLTASNCTFLRCATATNMLLALAEQFVPDGVGAFLGAAGGAVFSRGVTTMEGCAFLECRAAGAKVGCHGGAVFVDTGSHVTLRRSELRRNAAFGGSFMPAAGAIFVWTTGQLMLVDSRMNENVVFGGDASTGASGGALALAGPGSRASLVGSEPRRQHRWWGNLLRRSELGRRRLGICRQRGAGGWRKECRWRRDFERHCHASCELHNLCSQPCRWWRRQECWWRIDYCFRFGDAV
jgi:hypothetical protein